MFCTNCGRQIDDTAKFCDYCGTPVSDTDDAAPAQDRISTSPAAPQITVPASKPAGSGKVVTKRYHKPAIIVIVIIVVVAAAAIAIVAGLESHWNKKGDRAIETVQNSYFEFLPDITVGNLITAYYGEDYWTYNSDDVVEFFGTNQKDNTGLSIQFRQEDDHTVSVSDRMFRKADEASQEISEEEFESYMISLYDQLDGSTAKADTTEAVTKTTAAKETAAQQTTTKATTTEVAKSKNYMAYVDTIELYGGLADIAKNDYQESVAHREYYLYDIDQDGTQELLIRFGGSEADTETMVFTLDEDGTILDLGSFASGNTTLYQKDGKLYSSYAQMGHAIDRLFAFIECWINDDFPNDMEISSEFQEMKANQPNEEQKRLGAFACKQYHAYKLAAGVVCSKRLLNQAVGKSLRTHNLKPKKGAQVMRKNEKITALYERLSRDDFGKDDDQQRESNSISNQKAMLEEFAARQGFTNIVHFTDDGISGTCFDRPGFLAMMKEVEAGNVEYLCIKDMSHYRVLILMRIPTNVLLKKYING